MRWLLQAVLFLTGLFVVFTGINIGFGGLQSLGLQTSNHFFEVTDKAAFAIQDSHVRFVGGVWLGVGLAFLFGALAPRKAHGLLLVCCGLVFIGGLVRLASMQFALLFGPRMIGTVVAEIIGAPVLAAWILRARQP